MIDDEELVSVDGLVTGLSNTEILNGRKLGRNRIQAIAQIGLLFTPDRRTEILTAIQKY